MQGTSIDFTSEAQDRVEHVNAQTQESPVLGRLVPDPKTRVSAGTG